MQVGDVTRAHRVGTKGKDLLGGETEGTGGESRLRLTQNKFVLVEFKGYRETYAVEVVAENWTATC